MNKLTALEMDAERNGIILDWEAPINISTAIFKFDDFTVVGICEKNVKSHSEFTYKFSHEMGHFYTGTYYSPQSSVQERQRAEYRADEWAVNYLVPFDELLSALCSGYTQTWELSEYFNVPEYVIKRSFYIYRCKGYIE